MLFAAATALIDERIGDARADYARARFWGHTAVLSPPFSFWIANTRGLRAGGAAIAVAAATVAAVASLEGITGLIRGTSVRARVAKPVFTADDALHRAGAFAAPFMTDDRAPREELVANLTAGLSVYAIRVPVRT